MKGEPHTFGWRYGYEGLRFSGDVAPYHLSVNFTGTNLFADQFEWRNYAHRLRGADFPRRWTGYDFWEFERIDVARTQKDFGLAYTWPAPAMRSLHLTPSVEGTITEKGFGWLP